MKPHLGKIWGLGQGIGHDSLDLSTVVDFVLFVPLGSLQAKVPLLLVLLLLLVLQGFVSLVTPG